MNLDMNYLRNASNKYLLSGLYLSQKTIVTVGNFVITPLIISRLGNSSYVFWVSANAFTALLLLADWGFLNHFRVEMTSIYMREKIFHFGIWKQARNFMIYSGLILGMILALTINWVPIFNYTLRNQSLILLSFGILTIYLVLFEHLYILRYQVLNQEARSTFITFIYRSCEAFLQILLLIVHPSIYFVFGIPLVGRVGSLLTLTIRAPKIDKQLHSREKCDTSMMRAIQKSRGSFLFVLSNVAYANILTLILGAILSASAFTIFQISKMIMAPVLMIASSLTMGTSQQLLIEGIDNSAYYYKIRLKELIFPVFLLIGTVLFLLLLTPFIWINFFPSLGEVNLKLICLISMQYVLDGTVWYLSRDFYVLNRLFRIGLTNFLLSFLGIACIPIALSQLDVQSVPLILIFFDIIFLYFLIHPKRRKWLIQSV